MFARKSKHNNLSYSEYISAIDVEIEAEQFASALTLCNDAITYINRNYHDTRDVIATILAKVKVIKAMVDLKYILEAKPEIANKSTQLFRN